VLLTDIISEGSYPVLILDDFNLHSAENVQFVDLLYTAANHRHVKVFIFTKDNDWAATMIGINGGTSLSLKMSIMLGMARHP
jgi:hypothetical protein